MFPLIIILTTVYPPNLIIYSLSTFLLLGSSTFTAHSFNSKNLSFSAHAAIRVHTICIIINYAKGYGGCLLSATHKVLSYRLKIQNIIRYSNKVKQVALTGSAFALTSSISSPPHVEVGRNDFVLGICLMYLL